MTLFGTESTIKNKTMMGKTISDQTYFTNDNFKSKNVETREMNYFMKE